MSDFQTIKIFLASSEELNSDRKAFRNFCGNVNIVLAEHQYRIQPLMWEDFGAEYNLTRKQDDYNKKIRESNIVLVLFKTIAGQYTIEELQVAVESHESSDVLVYQKTLGDNQSHSDSFETLHRDYDDKVNFRDYSFIDKINIDLIEKLKNFIPESILETCEKGDFIALGKFKIADKRKIK